MANLKWQMVRRGFTLVELLVVISIIGILATIFISTFSSSQARARDGQRKFDLKNLQGALEQYFYAQNPQTYPNTNVWNTMVGCLQNGCPVSGTAPNFLKTAPSDPSSSNPPYTYASQSCGGTPTVCTNYEICAKLENGADPDIPKYVCSNNTYNYGLHAP